MITEDEKRIALVDYFNFRNNSLDKLCHGKNFQNWVHICVDFVRFLPNWSTLDIEHRNSLLQNYWINSDGLSDLDAMAYILAYTNFDNWIKADMAKIYHVKASYGTSILCYRNVHMQRRKKWGIFL